VIGEMLAGLLLGPTFFGWMDPDAQRWLYPQEGPAAIALDGIVILAVTMLLLVAGMEVDLKSARQQGRSALLVTLAGVVVPLVAGGTVAWIAPATWGMPPNGDPQLFSVFFGTALCVSALPVIAKLLLDLDLFQTEVGMLVLISATLTNLLAWLCFSVVLSGAEGFGSITYMVVLTVAFALAMVTVGCWVANACLSLLQAHLPSPAGVLGFILVAGLLGAAVTEAIGIHAIFGAFLTGIALGESRHMREQTRHIVHRFVEGVLAPIFVAAIGLEVNFVANFQPRLVLSVLALGIAVKVFAVYAGARVAGWSRLESWAIGWALNARGELGIVLGLLAFESGLIRERLFVAIVTLAIVTTALAGPMMKWLLRRQKSFSLSALLEAHSCLPQLDAATVLDVVRRLSCAVADQVKRDPEEIVKAVMARERVMGTGLGRGIAVPHARLPGLPGPVLVACTTRNAIDFEGVDEEPVRTIFLCLTPLDDHQSQLQILSAIARLSKSQDFQHDILEARTSAEILGVVRITDQLQAKD
jgi:Kef-type K+ transport system membrane component KefB/mannitol/fructose-specific phosphotransferase system IIA component